ncbi:hypothetical protein ESZ36_02375 [Colwellia demingiae]|uniref:Uncharacterized protein n=1 Tax=Colwellia demingiae TaxID=89401 RepID=A0A5C6QS70_9GAMM|nr:hypothetical protein [Colwellia demingiae]TWX72096.1 hypothetical protein ESZ36_02375 [Colwellia demingiae]
MLLKTMENKWTGLGIEDWFVSVHHFSSSKLASKPSTLTAFVSYCEGKDIRGENVQTVKRALKVACYVSEGIGPSDAIKIAWRRYPLVVRY